MGAGPRLRAVGTPPRDHGTPPRAMTTGLRSVTTAPHVVTTGPRRAPWAPRLPARHARPSLSFLSGNHWQVTGNTE